MAETIRGHFGAGLIGGAEDQHTNELALPQHGSHHTGPESGTVNRAADTFEFRARQQQRTDPDVFSVGVQHRRQSFGVINVQFRPGAQAETLESTVALQEDQAGEVDEVELGRRLAKALRRLFHRIGPLNVAHNFNNGVAVSHFTVKVFGEE